MIMSLLFSAVAWNLGTWYVGLPVSSSHTLIGSIVGVGLASSLMAGQGTSGVNWGKALSTLEGLAFAPVLGFVGSAVLLLVMKLFIRAPRLYVPPVGEDTPPWWIRAVLILTCGSVSLSHGSNDGQKGMGLVLILLFGFLPAHYALNPGGGPDEVAAVVSAAAAVRPAAEAATANKDAQKLAKNAAFLEDKLAGKRSFLEIDPAERGEVRVAAAEAAKALKKDDIKKLLADAGVEEIEAKRHAIRESHEHIPLWVVVSVALALGGGTMVGYKRIVETVALKIGKSHLTYGQGAAAELVGALTIAGASYIALPVSTTQIVTSGVAGTMVANGDGVQRRTVTRILLAWLLTLPATVVLAGVVYYIGIHLFVT
jgi:phosphate/sulfate permease